jgi:hypothetical protein
MKSNPKIKSKVFFAYFVFIISLSCSEDKEISREFSICDPENPVVLVTVKNGEYWISGDDETKTYELSLRDTLNWSEKSSRVSFSIPGYKEKRGLCCFRPCNLPANLKSNTLVRVSGNTYISKDNFEKLRNNWDKPEEPTNTPVSYDSALPFRITEIEVINK